MVESDEEQLEVLKNWWDENGTSLLTTVALSLMVIFGYRAWEDNTRETGEAASRTYENLVQATANVSDENLKTTAITLGEELKTEHEGSTYAIFAALHLARVAAESDDLDGAQSQLEWVMDQRPEGHIETITRMRLARVLIAKGDPTAAMSKLVNHEPAESQKSRWDETRGDVFVALGDDANAREAYEMALEVLDENGRLSNPLLALKLADIPVTREAAAAQPEDEDEDA